MIPDQTPGATPRRRTPHWYACYTRGRHEKKVRQRLEDRGFEVFLPLVSLTRQWHDRKKVVELPLFPSYLFTRCVRGALGEALTVPGLVEVVRFDGSPVAISSDEIENIRRLCKQLPKTGSAPPVAPMVRKGETVRIVAGPLQGVRGMVAEHRGRERVLLQVGVRALRQGIKIEVDRSSVRPLRD